VHNQERARRHPAHRFERRVPYLHNGCNAGPQRPAEDPQEARPDDALAEPWWAHRAGDAHHPVQGDPFCTCPDRGRGAQRDPHSIDTGIAESPCLLSHRSQVMARTGEIHGCGATAPAMPRLIVGDHIETTEQMVSKAQQPEILFTL